MKSERKDRIPGYDFARASAVFGMAVVHFCLVMSFAHWGSGWLSRIIELFDGRAAATFVVLAGVGLTLRSRRAVESGDGRALANVRATLVKRGTFLLAAGFLNLAVWTGDILRVYGFSFLLAVWFLRARDRWLWIASFAFVFIFVVLIFLVDYEENWIWETLTYRNLWTFEGAVRNVFYDGFRTVFPWTAFLFLGMWLGRRNMQDRRTRRKVFFWGLGIAVAAELISRMLVDYFLANPGDMDEDTITALFGTQSMPPLPLFLLASGGVAAAVIALSLMVAERYSETFWVKAVVATGQMAFTWYIGHIIIGLGAVILMGFVATCPLIWGLVAATAFFVLAAVASLAWKSRAKHGPVEWFMRKITG